MKDIKIPSCEITLFVHYAPASCSTRVNARFRVRYTYEMLRPFDTYTHAVITTRCVYDVRTSGKSPSLSDRLIRAHVCGRPVRPDYRLLAVPFASDALRLRARFATGVANLPGFTRTVPMLLVSAQWPRCAGRRPSGFQPSLYSSCVFGRSEFHEGRNCHG